MHVHGHLMPVTTFQAHVRPFEEEMRAWEERLIAMQDILDAWTRCQVIQLFFWTVDGQHCSIVPYTYRSPGFTLNRYLILRTS